MLNNILSSMAGPMSMSQMNNSSNIPGLNNLLGLGGGNAMSGLHGMMPNMSSFNNYQNPLLNGSL